MKSNMTPVKFVRDWGTYAAGETAGFSTAYAEQLVTSGAATHVKRTSLGRREAKVTADLPRAVVHK